MSEEHKTAEDVYNEGRTAARAGIPKDDNPYPPGTWKALAWETGWVSAQDDAGPVQEL